MTDVSVATVTRTRNDASNTSTAYVEVPAEIWPKLPKGKLHKFRLTPYQIEIESYENIFGNNSADRLLSIPYTQIDAIRFKKPFSHAVKGRCQISYRDGLQVKRLKFCAMGSDAHFNNQLTAAIVETLELLHHGSHTLASDQVRIELKPPNSLWKFFAGLSLFSGLFLLGSRRFGIGSLFFFGVLLFYPSLIALGIDYIRLNTGWPFLLKLISYVIIFIIGFVMMITTIFLIEAHGGFF
jgi:hypothetical protein